MNVTTTAYDLTFVELVASDVGNGGTKCKIESVAKPVALPRTGDVASIPFIQVTDASGSKRPYLSDRSIS